MYGICRIEKVKATGVAAMEKHNDRLWECRNGDIDHERSHENAELLERSGRYAEAVEERIAEGYTGKRAVRKDAVRLVEGIITASPEFFEGKSRDECMAFFRNALEFTEGEFGSANMVHFTVHFDEKTPHAHFGFVPLTDDGRLSAKAWFNGRESLRGLQNRFFEQVAEPWGLERGELAEETERRHKSVVEMKRDEIADLREKCERLQNEVETMSQERDEARSEAREARNEVNRLQAEVEGQRAALERLSERFKTILRHITEVADTLSRRPFIFSWKSSLEALRDNPIAREAVKAGQPWQKERDAKRADRAIRHEVQEQKRSIVSLLDEAKELQRAKSELAGERAKRPYRDNRDR